MATDMPYGHSKSHLAFGNLNGDRNAIQVGRRPNWHPNGMPLGFQWVPHLDPNRMHSASHSTFVEKSLIQNNPGVLASCIFHVLYSFDSWSNKLSVVFPIRSHEHVYVDEAYLVDSNTLKCVFFRID